MITDVKIRRVADLDDDGMREIRRLFFGEDCELLTDDLIAELRASGWSDEVLRDARVRGGLYCRPRDSIVYPPRLVWS